MVNALILVVGGVESGPEVMGVGLFLVLTFAPFHVRARLIGSRLGS